MTDRVSHDHPTVDTIDATLERYGGTTRPEIRLPASDAVPVGEVVRIVLAGTTYRTQIAEREDGTAAIRGAYETPRLARNPGSASDALQLWVAERDLEFGRTVHVDVVEPGVKLGLRAPGETATYASIGRPKDSLASIAKDLEEN
ncbi:MAG: hypothetical protein ABEJ59_03765 [Halanaeroarchaeum sp.]